MQQREWHQCPLMPADSEPQGRHNHSPNWVMVGKAITRWGSEIGRYTPLGRGKKWHLPPECRILPPTGIWTLAALRGMVSDPPLKMTKKPEFNKKPETDSQSMRTCLQKDGGRWLDDPWGITWVTGLNSPQIITPTELKTAIDSIIISFICKRLCFYNIFYVRYVAFGKVGCR